MVMKPFRELGRMWAHDHGFHEPDRMLPKTVVRWELVELTFVGGQLFLDQI